MRPLEDELTDRLRALADQGLARSLREPSGLDFSSNDYLGLANDPALRTALGERLAVLAGPGPLSAGDEPWSAPSSRLLRGETAAHAGLERRLARFKG